MLQLHKKKEEGDKETPGPQSSNLAGDESKFQHRTFDVETPAGVGRGSMKGYSRFLSIGNHSSLYSVDQPNSPPAEDGYDKPPSMEAVDVTEARQPVQDNIRTMEKKLFSKDPAILEKVHKARSTREVKRSESETKEESAMVKVKEDSISGTLSPKMTKTLVEAEMMVNSALAELDVKDFLKCRTFGSPEVRDVFAAITVLLEDGAKDFSFAGTKRRLANAPKFINSLKKMMRDVKKGLVPEAKFQELRPYLAALEQYSFNDLAQKSLAPALLLKYAKNLVAYRDTLVQEDSGCPPRPRKEPRPVPSRAPPNYRPQYFLEAPSHLQHSQQRHKKGRSSPNSAGCQEKSESDNVTKSSSSSSTRLSMQARKNLLKSAMRKSSSTQDYPRTSTASPAPKRSQLEKNEVVKKSDLTELKVMTKPPVVIKLVLEAVFILLFPNVKDKDINWGEIKKRVLGDSRILSKLLAFDKGTVSLLTLRRLKKYIENPDLSPECVAKSSKAAASLALWVRETYSAIHLEPTETSEKDPNQDTDSSSGSISNISSILSIRSQRLASEDIRRQKKETANLDQLNLQEDVAISKATTVNQVNMAMRKTRAIPRSDISDPPIVSSSKSKKKASISLPSKGKPQAMELAHASPLTQTKNRPSKKSKKMKTKRKAALQSSEDILKHNESDHEGKLPEENQALESELWQGVEDSFHSKKEMISKPIQSKTVREIEDAAARVIQRMMRSKLTYRLLMRRSHSNLYSDFLKTMEMVARFQNTPPSTTKMLSKGGKASSSQETQLDTFATRAKYRVLQELKDATRATENEKEMLATMPNKGGALVDAKANDGRTPLHVASAYGKFEAAKLLLQHGGSHFSGLFSTEICKDMFEAASTGTLVKLKKVLQAGANINWRHPGRGNRTALHEACAVGRLEHAALLLEHGAVIDSVDEKDATPLDEALRSGQVALVKLLMERGADLNAGNFKLGERIESEGINGILKQGVLFSHYPNTETRESVATMLISGKMMVNGYNLVIASQQGDLLQVQDLVEHGSDVNYRSAQGSTALHEACSRGHVEVTAFLLESGADPLYRDAGGELPGQSFQESTPNISQSKVKQLLDQESNGAGKEFLVDVMNNKISKVRARLALDMDVNYTAPFTQNTALLIASMSGFLEVAELLLEKGANILAKTRTGDSVLHFAATYKELCALLLRKGADVDSTNQFGKSPLHAAVEADHYEVILLLLLKGAQIEIRDNRGQTAVHQAAFLGTSLKAFACLLEETTVKEVLEVPDLDGRTPLFLSCWQGHFQHSKMLLEHGARPNTNRDVHHKLPLEYNNFSEELCKEFSDLLTTESATFCQQGYALVFASRTGDAGRVQEILSLSERSHLVNYKDARGRTAVHQAAMYGHVEIVRFLALERSADISIPDEEGTIPGLKFSRGVSQAPRHQILEILRSSAQQSPDMYSNILNELNSRNLDSGDEDAGPESNRSEEFLRILELESQSSSGYKVIDWEELLLETVIGEGSFGVVRKATWRGMEVAVKELKLGNFTGMETQCVEDLRHEAQVLARVCNHSCVVQFVGVTLSPLTIITRYMKNGSVEELLVNTDEEYEMDLIVRMALEAAKGVVHLHAEGIIHRDLAARNLLIDEYMHVRVADFGFARVKDVCLSRGYTSSDMGPIKWTAPEAMRRKEYSESSDVFSFGVVLYEMLARAPPWEGLENLDAAFQVCSGERMKLPEMLPDKYTNLIRDCWGHEPQERPSMYEVIEVLEHSKTLQESDIAAFFTQSAHTYSNISIPEQTNLIESKRAMGGEIIREYSGSNSSELEHTHSKIHIEPEPT